jgi:hypothetical protein
MVDEIGQQRPRARRVLVEPSRSPSGILTPSGVIASATTCMRPSTSKPSSIITRQAHVIDRGSSAHRAQCGCALDEQLRHRRPRRRRGRLLDVVPTGSPTRANLRVGRPRACGPSPLASAGHGRRRTHMTAPSARACRQPVFVAAESARLAAERHRSVLVAVAVGCPGRRCACLRPTTSS